MPCDLDLFEAIATRRRSVRAFLPQPVERTLIERAVIAASTAPSSCNTQPWRLHIVSGEKLAQLSAALRGAAQGGESTAPDVQYAQPYRGIYRERQIDAAKLLFAAQGVERKDHEGRTRSFLLNYTFFGAPHAAFLFTSPDGGPRETADCGKFAQTFMLALAAAGIGSCPQGSLSDYPGIVRQVLNLQEDGRLLMGISFGYADPEDPSVAVRPQRASLKDLATFH